jgi:hypothetical protein
MQNWPKGTGEWRPIETLVITDSEGTHEQGTLVVPTPLDMIGCLEDKRIPIATVILAGRYARDREMASSLQELYPDVSVALRMAGG